MEHVEFDFRKLRGKIVEKFDTQEAFAQQVGQTPTTISYKLNNKKPMTRSDIIEWSRVLSIEPDNIGKYFFAEKV